MCSYRHCSTQVRDISSLNFIVIIRSDHESKNGIIERYKKALICTRRSRISKTFDQAKKGLQIVSWWMRRVGWANILLKAHVRRTSLKVLAEHNSQKVKYNETNLLISRRTSIARPSRLEEIQTKVFNFLEKPRCKSGMDETTLRKITFRQYQVKSIGSRWSLSHSFHVHNVTLLIDHNIFNNTSIRGKV